MKNFTIFSSVFLYKYKEFRRKPCYIYITGLFFNYDSLDFLLFAYNNMNAPEIHKLIETNPYKLFT